MPQNGAAGAEWKRLLDALGAEDGADPLCRRRGSRRFAGSAGKRRRSRDAAPAGRGHSAARAARIKAVPTGIDHGTITAVSDGQPYEVTTLRRDVATDGRRATVAFTDDWEEDAARRDFTINALVGGPGDRRGVRLFRRARRPRRAARPFHRRSASSASPKIICGSSATSASMRDSARATRTQRRSTPARRARTTSWRCPASGSRTSS